MDQAPDYEEIRQRAFRLLARREHSEHELRQKLIARGAVSEHLERLLPALKADNYLSDQRFTDALVRNRIERGQGPLKIRYELNQKGVAAELIELAVDETDPMWVKQLRSVWSKKFNNDMPKNYEQWARQARFLQTRGFTTEQIRAVVSYREQDR